MLRRKPWASWQIELSLSRQQRNAEMAYSDARLMLDLTLRANVSDKDRAGMLAMVVERQRRAARISKDAREAYADTAAAAARERAWYERKLLV